MFDQEQTDFPGLFAAGQIRLEELSVYNWGSFHGLHTAHIDPHGTLVTGDNGAGKSTLIDGLMALLLPAGGANFNIAAAQGDRTDRSLISYIRGSFGSTHDGSQTQTQNKRAGATVSGLRAFYRSEDGSQISIAALFWMTQSSNALADLKRIYVVAKRNLQLEEMLQAFGEGNARTLKQFLRDDKLIMSCDDNFAAYQEVYRKLLHMENSNAPALLSRALGLKKIDDLTKLIRELVLEPSLVRDHARKAVLEFDDLDGVHNRLLDARAQRDTLAALPDVAEELEQAKKDIAAFSAELEGLPVYFAEQMHRLWSERLQQLKLTLQDAEQRLQQIEAREIAARERTERLHGEYLNLGGNRIEELKKDIERTREKLESTTRQASQYQEITRALELDPTLNESTFQANLDKQQTALETTEQEKTAAEDAFAQTAVGLSQAQQTKKDLDEEIEAIASRPNSNIDIAHQRLRDEMCQSLQLAPDDVPFLGELMDVNPEQRHWQGAIERALGGLRTTMAVPEARLSLITRWLNQRHTGLHVRVQAVTTSTQTHKGTATFKSDGFLRKLQWREHPYREWLKQHLQRFDLHCVDSTEALDRTPFSLTEQGLIHFDKGRFEKKDRQRIDDKRQWQLGFSNKLRLATLRSEAEQLQTEIRELTRQTQIRRKAMDQMVAKAQFWKQLGEFQWQDINAPHWQSILQNQRLDLQALESSGSDLEQAKQRWEDAKQKLAEIGVEKVTQNKVIGGHEKEIETAQNALELTWNIAETGLEDWVRELLTKRIGTITPDKLDTAQQLENHCRESISKQNHSAETRKSNAGNRAVAIMSSFYAKETWQTIASDWGRSLDSMDEYLQHLHKLEAEGLPALVDKFKERLNKHTTYSLAGIKSRIDAEKEEISERIDVINRVLCRTEFRVGSHLRLGIKPEQFQHVQEFNRMLVRVLSEAGSDDHELRFRHLQEVITLLDKASNSTTAHNKESLRLLDPRYQLTFFAEEVEAQTGKIRDVLMSSSGKSGGEKESFAGTIVAASLAYVLTPDGHDKPVYCTVFLDEAFSNTAEAVSRRVLRVFKELHIHINLITPYKNLNLARESARSLLIAERDVETHESRLCEVTWEELDKMQANAELTATVATDLGIELGSHQNSHSNSQPNQLSPEPA